MNGWEILQHIWRLQQVVLREASPCLERHGLFRMAPFALAMVRRCGTPSGVAAALGLPAPTVSHILRRLEAEGWVTRQVDPDDLRRHRLALTPSGLEALRAARSCLEAAMEGRLEALTPPEREQLARLLARLHGDLPDPPGEPPRDLRDGAEHDGTEREGAVSREGAEEAGDAGRPGR
ncbi:MarR family winged helix-turn-helix transcriptional regulator [Thermaerobacter litoralis]